MNEKQQFAGRLRAAMVAAGYEPRPSVLEAHFNSRYWGRSVTYQAVRRWLIGLSIPEQEKLQVLADWLGVEPHVLRFGHAAGRLRISEPRAIWAAAAHPADRKAVEGVSSVGGGKAHQIRFGLLPQVLPVIASQVLYFIESNTRSSTIIGIVGAGGIGLYLAETIRTLEWQQVSFLILLILAAVSAIDFLSSKLRFAIIGKRAV